MKLPKINKQKAGLWLMLAGAAIVLYLVLAPFWPAWQYELFIKPGFTAEDTSAPVEVIGEDKIVIKKIGVNAPVVATRSEEEGLSQGAWLMPSLSRPNLTGKTVITAHRFKYLPPNNKTFYNLDKLENGDIISVHWQGKAYDYEVIGSQVVDKFDFSVLEPTEDKILTLFTCHPVFSDKQRLIVNAKPI